MATFVFPNDCFNSKQPDEAYKERYMAASVAIRFNAVINTNY